MFPNILLVALHNIVMREETWSPRGAGLKGKEVRVEALEDALTDVASAPSRGNRTEP